jgi:hypothetical protein
MSSRQSAPKQPRPARGDTATATASKKTPPKKASGQPLSVDQRLAMIAKFAYFRAEQRGFHTGDPMADWLESEKEVDALLSRGAD